MTAVNAALSPFEALKLAAITPEIPDTYVRSLALDLTIESEDQIHELMGFLSKHRPALMGELARRLAAASP